MGTIRTQYRLVTVLSVLLLAAWCCLAMPAREMPKVEARPGGSSSVRVHGTLYAWNGDSNKWVTVPANWQVQVHLHYTTSGTDIDLYRWATTDDLGDFVATWGIGTDLFSGISPTNPTAAPFKIKDTTGTDKTLAMIAPSWSTPYVGSVSIPLDGFGHWKDVDCYITGGPGIDIGLDDPEPEISPN